MAQGRGSTLLLKRTTLSVAISEGCFGFSQDDDFKELAKGYQPKKQNFRNFQEVVGITSGVKRSRCRGCSRHLEPTEQVQLRLSICTSTFQQKYTNFARVF